MLWTFTVRLDCRIFVFIARNALTLAITDTCPPEPTKIRRIKMLPGFTFAGTERLIRMNAKRLTPSKALKISERFAHPLDVFYLMPTSSCNLFTFLMEQDEKTTLQLCKRLKVNPVLAAMARSCEWYDEEDFSTTSWLLKQLWTELKTRQWCNDEGVTDKNSVTDRTGQRITYHFHPTSCGWSPLYSSVCIDAERGYEADFLHPVFFGAFAPGNSAQWPTIENVLELSLQRGPMQHSFNHLFQQILAVSSPGRSLLVLLYAERKIGLAKTLPTQIRNLIAYQACFTTTRSDFAKAVESLKCSSHFEDHGGLDHDTSRMNNAQLMESLLRFVHADEASIRNTLAALRFYCPGFATPL